MLGENYTPSAAKARRRACSPCRYAPRNTPERRERHNELAASWAKANPERRQEQYLRSYRKRMPHMPGYAAAHRGYERALRLGSVPPEVTRDGAVADTLPIYRLAAELTASTGSRHEVDHVIPIGLGGMHVPDNLQAIPASDHHRKSIKDRQQIKEARDAARRQRRGW